MIEREIMKFIQSLKVRLDYFKNYKKYQEEEENDVARISYLENEKRKIKNTLNLKNEELKKQIEELKKQIDDLSVKLSAKNILVTKWQKKTNELTTDKKLLNDYIDELEKENKKLKETIHELSGSKGGLIKQNNKLHEALEEMTKRYMFAVNNRRAPSMEEIRAYMNGEREVLKRIKENSNEKAKK